MEILVEILVQLVCFLLEIFGEALFQGVFELITELGFRSLGEPFKRQDSINPILAAICYLLYGAIAGCVSLLIPKVFDVPHMWRIANVIFTPIICGYVMAALGRFRSRRGSEPIRLDTFSYGYLFALGMAVVRYVWR